MPIFNPKKVFFEARTEEKAGLHKSASRKYAKIASYLLRRDKYDEASQLLLRAIDLHPESPRLYLAKAVCEKGREKPKAAQEAIKEFMRFSGQKKKGREYALLVEAKLESAPELRELYYQLACDNEPVDAAPYLGWARALFAQRKLEPAKEVLIRALRTGTRRSDVVSQLRIVLEALNHMEALFYLQRYESGEISRPELILLLSEGKHFLRTHTSVSEEKELGTLVRELEAELGLEAVDAVELDAVALDDFEAELEKRVAGESALRLELAVGTFMLGLLDTALRLLAGIKPKELLYWKAQHLSGQFYFEKKDYLKALPFFQRCLRHSHREDPISIDASYHLLQIYYRLGDLKRAWELVEELTELQPEYRELRHLRNRIEGRVAEIKQTG